MSNVKPVLSDKNSGNTDTHYEEFDFEAEFAIILNSALNHNNIPQEVHYVNRTKKMQFLNQDNFYTLAAETVVACFSLNHDKLEKYHTIHVCLERARSAVDRASKSELKALKKIEKLSEMIMDIFDC
ncbi:MAG: hypothetical protein PHW24_01545 [Candidatus Moranbacteria bacterium]|nr:hypothetical protein [Candidatus Moranbacteria bacterium]